MLESIEERRWEITWGGFVAELKKAASIAAPMVAVTVFQYLLRVVSVVVVGHVGQLPLSSVAIATSITNVTGFSRLSGMAGGLETLCGQAYGAQQYQKLGVYTYSAIISLTLVCPPVCVLWIFFNKLLPLVGQDPTISHHARNFSICLIPALFGAAILKVLTGYLQTQSLILPMFLSSFSVLCFLVPVCWILVFKSRLGYLEAAVAFSLSTCLNVAMLGFYVKNSSACKKTQVPLSKEAFLSVGKFFQLGIPSAVMVCLTISTLHFTIPDGFGAAASVPVSNEMGAWNPQSAGVAVWATMFLGITELAIVGTILFSCWFVVGYAYSNDKQLVEYVVAMVPLVCASVITDSLQAVLSGVARGSRWQHLGAYINLFAFYLIGLPVATSPSFIAHLRGKGHWISIVAGSVLQTTLLLLITGLTNWQKQATEARAGEIGDESH